MLSEGRKRDAAANAVLALSFAANAAQSPQAFVSSGEKAAPSLPLMGELMRKRKEANRNLDSARVSEPARNRKKKNFSESKRLKKWWNKGRNERVPNENKASWKELMDDDRKQLTRTDTSFKKGETGVKGWRPHKAFSPRMIKTGPTPAVRQAFERPVRAVSKIFNKEDIQSSKMKTFKKFLEEAHLIEAKQPTFSSRAELEKHHKGIPAGMYANNAGSTENPKWRLKPKSGGAQEKKARAERIASLSSHSERSAADAKKRKLHKAGLDAHHITPTHYSAKIKSSMSDAEWEAKKKKDAASGIYHGHHPKNLMGATTDKTPEKHSKRGIRHRAGGAHELEGKTKELYSGSISHKDLLAAAQRRRLRKEKGINK